MNILLKAINHKSSRLKDIKIMISYMVVQMFKIIENHFKKIRFKREKEFQNPALLNTTGLIIKMKRIS